MDSPNSSEDYVPTLYIGQHESDRSEPVTNELVHRAHDFNVGFGRLMWARR